MCKYMESTTIKAIIVIKDKMGCLQNKLIQLALASVCRVTDQIAVS